MQDIYVILVGPKKNNNDYSEHNPLRNILFFVPFKSFQLICFKLHTLWFQLEDMFPSISSPPLLKSKILHTLLSDLIYILSALVPNRRHLPIINPINALRH